MNSCPRRKFWLKEPTHGGTVQADTLRISKVGFSLAFIVILIFGVLLPVVTL